MTAKVFASPLARQRTSLFLTWIKARRQEPLGRVPLLARIPEANRRITNHQDSVLLTV
jgi:hypothetical protein